MENKIEIGEYARTNRGIIGKIREILPNSKYIYGVNHSMYSDKEIVKHSKDIIDLVEVGDFVNGYRIDIIKDGILISNPKGIDRSGAFIPTAQYSKDIKSILTHEQYKRNCYRLEE